MSKITEMARAEAEAAEAAETDDDDNGDDDNGDEDERSLTGSGTGQPAGSAGEPATDAAVAPAPPVDQAKQLQRLDRENERHEREARKIMGEDMDNFHECPLCILGPRGYVMPLQVLPREVQDTIREGVNLYVGSPIPDATELRAAEGKEACPKCDGWGMQRTGSRHPQHVIDVCERCNGNGHVPKAVDAQQPTPVTPLYPQPVQPAQPQYADYYGNATPYAPDAVGRPWLHPQYGHPVDNHQPQPVA